MADEVAVAGVGDRFTPWPFDVESGCEAHGDVRTRQFAATKWRLENGGSYQQRTDLSAEVSGELVRELRRGCAQAW